MRFALAQECPDAFLRVWYSLDDQSRLAELRDRLTAATAKLGPVVDTEVFAPRMIGKRVTRIYGVIYFNKRPL